MSSNQVVIKICDKNDIPKIQNVLWNTMKDTYSFMKKETLEEFFNFNYQENKLKRILELNDNSFYIALINDEEVGVIHFYNDLDDLYFQINALYVLPKYQNSGVGKILVKKVIEIVSKHKISRVYLGVFVDNKRTFELYKKTNLNIIKQKTEKFQLESFEYVEGFIKLEDLIQKLK